MSTHTHTHKQIPESSSPVEISESCRGSSLVLHAWADNMLSFNLKIKQRLLHWNIVLDKDSEGGAGGEPAGLQSYTTMYLFIKK